MQLISVISKIILTFIIVHLIQSVRMEVADLIWLARLLVRLVLINVHPSRVSTDVMDRIAAANSGNS